METNDERDFYFEQIKNLLSLSNNKLSIIAGCTVFASTILKPGLNPKITEEETNEIEIYLHHLLSFMLKQKYAFRNEDFDIILMHVNDYNLEEITKFVFDEIKYFIYNE